jgi:RNA polymerase sigma factor (sigma-70 family)
VWEHKIEPKHEHFSKFGISVTVCVCYYAQQAERNVEESVDGIIESLENERHPSTGTSMGGNPVRDCVLATAMLLKSGTAVIRFETDYSAFLRGVAYKVHRNFGNEPDEWWNEFLDFLAGYSSENGKLNKYEGKSALKFWLRIVLWNFLKRRPIPSEADEFLNELPDRHSNKQVAEMSEHLMLFANIVRKALQAIPEKEKLLLAMLYIDNMKKNAAAAVFNVHPGQIGRWEENAIEHFRQELQKCAKEVSQDSWNEILADGLGNNPKEFGNIIAANLRKNTNTDNDIERKNSITG